MAIVQITSPDAVSPKPRRTSTRDRIPVSAAIITYNEARRIRECIESLDGLVDEIVVLDSDSQDRTKEIALGYGAKVHTAEWVGYGPQKRRAEEFCKHPWILSIDADERLSPDLAEEIRHAFTNGTPSADAYTLRIADRFPHEEEPAPWAYTYRRIRLYDKRKGRFADSLVHDDVVMGDGMRVLDLQAKVSHLSLESLSAATAKFNRYTDLQAEDMSQRGRRVSGLRILTEFPVAFCKSYFLRRRCLYGIWGVIHSITYAHMRFLRIAKAYERQSRENP